MWVLNLCLPLAFMTSLAFAVNFIGLENTSDESGQLPTAESIGTSDGECASPRSLMERCRIIVTVTLFFVTVITVCLLMGCMSARANTYLIAFVVVGFGITCDHVVARD